MKYIIEGIDRLGKGTLIAGLCGQFWVHQKVHMDKPKLEPSFLALAGDDKNLALKYYQEREYLKMFETLAQPDKTIIYDRGHLGECVYAPLYRKYSGDYVFNLEKAYPLDDVALILMTTDNFDFLKDDGESFDFDAKEDEQDLFLNAFTRSCIKNKHIINVHDGKGGYRSKEDILNEVLKKTVQSK